MTNMGAPNGSPGRGSRFAGVAKLAAACCLVFVTCGPAVDAQEDNAAAFFRADRERLANAGVSAVYTPKDFELSKIMRDVADLTAAHRANS